MERADSSGHTYPGEILNRKANECVVSREVWTGGDLYLSGVVTQVIPEEDEGMNWQWGSGGPDHGNAVMRVSNGRGDWVLVKGGPGNVGVFKKKQGKRVF